MALPATGEAATTEATAADGQPGDGRPDYERIARPGRGTGSAKRITWDISTEKQGSCPTAIVHSIGYERQGSDKCGFHRG